jgi:hypothetical protein
LRVFLRLIVDESNLGSEWRGALAPTDRGAWFASYQHILVSYATAAEASDVDYLSVGNELNSLQGDPGWLSLIPATRAVFHGALTYCRNWDAPTPGFSSLLDLAGVDGYWPLSAPPSPTTSQLVDAWQPWVRQIAAENRAAVKPVMLCEIGIAPRTDAFRNPAIWKSAPDTAWDPGQQASYFQASISATEGLVAGWYWWDMELAVPAVRPPASTPQFDFLGLPAEEILSKNYGRLRNR